MIISGFTTAILNLRLNGASWDVGDSTIESAMSKNTGVDTRIMFLSGRVLELQGVEDLSPPSLFALQNQLRCPRVKKWLEESAIETACLIGP